MLKRTAVSLVLMATAAGATTIGPGQCAGPTAGCLPLTLQNGITPGTLLDQRDAIIELSGNTVGTFTSAVFRTDDGLLHFYYQFGVAAGSSYTTNKARFISLQPTLPAPLAPFDIGVRDDAVANMQAGGIRPDRILYEQSSLVETDFTSDPIGPGEYSSTMVLTTSQADRYTLYDGQYLAQDLGFAVLYSTDGSFVTAAVKGPVLTTDSVANAPEPVSAGLIIAGLAACFIGTKRLPGRVQF